MTGGVQLHSQRLASAQLGAISPYSISSDSTTLRDAARETAERAGHSMERGAVGITLARTLDNMPLPKSANVASSSMPTLSYANLLGLSKDVSFGDNMRRLSPSNLTAHLRSEGITPGRYLKETLVGNNVSDIKNIRNQVGSGLFRLVGLGTVGLDVARTTREGYRQAKAKYDDGSLGGKFKTWGETGKVMLSKTGKNLVSWEVGGLGFSVASTLTASALAGVSLPAVVAAGIPIAAGLTVGAVAGAITSRQLDKRLPTPKRPSGDDVNSLLASSSQTLARKDNPFEQVSLPA